VVIAGCSHEDVRQWDVWLGWCHRLIIVVGEGDGHAIVVIGSDNERAGIRKVATGCCGVGGVSW
jgi:hypothetical protein